MCAIPRIGFDQMCNYHVSPSSLLFFAVTTTVDLSFSKLFLTFARIAMHTVDMKNSAWTLEVLKEDFRLGRYRQAAADPCYSILPPVWDKLKTNSKQLQPLLWVAKPGGLRANALQKARLLMAVHTQWRFNAVRMNKDTFIHRQHAEEVC